MKQEMVPEIIEYKGEEYTVNSVEHILTLQTQEVNKKGETVTAEQQFFSLQATKEDKHYRGTLKALCIPDEEPIIELPVGFVSYIKRPEPSKTMVEGFIKHMKHPVAREEQSN